MTQKIPILCRTKAQTDPKTVPPYVKECECSGCKEILFASPSSILLVDQGKCELICYDCAEQQLGPDTIITMAPGAREEFKTYQRQEAEKN
jgi:hypothetical protein